MGQLVHDGDTVALEGCTHLVPYAAGHEIIRQGKSGLTLVRMTPDLIYDQLLGMGCARKLVFSWGDQGRVGPLPRLRDAMEKGWPQPLEVEEHSHAGMANAYAAGASDLPFAAMRGYAGCNPSGLERHVRPVICPFTGEALVAVPSVRPDVAVIHAQKADRRGNVLLWGILGVQKEAVLAAREVIVTVEEIVDNLEAWPGACVLPSRVVSAVCPVPGGAWPSSALGYYGRDEASYRAWGKIAGDRQGFLAWMRRHVLETEDHEEFRRVHAKTSSEMPAQGRARPRGRAFSAAEMMTVAAARMLKDRSVCFVGAGLPTKAASLARLTHAPELVLIGESGPIETSFELLSFSGGDGEQVVSADAMVSTPEIFRYWLQGGRIDVGFVSAAQVDRFGNLNPAVAAGPRGRARMRSRGSGGWPEVAAMAGEVLVVMRQSRRSFVERVDTAASAARLDGGDAPRQRAGLSGQGPTAIITDLGIMTPDPVTKEFTLTSVHPGVSIDQVQAATGWDLKVAPEVATTRAPAPRELRLLRGALGAAAQVVPRQVA